MATLNIRKAVTSKDYDEAKDIWQLQPEERREGMPSAYTEVSNAVEKSFAGAQLVALTRNTDPASPTYGLLEVTLQPDHETTREVREFLEDGVGFGWEMTTEGTIRLTPVVPEARTNTYSSYQKSAEILLGSDWREHHYRYGPLMRDVNLSVQIDYEERDIAIVAQWAKRLTQGMNDEWLLLENTEDFEPRVGSAEINFTHPIAGDVCFEGWSEKEALFCDGDLFSWPMKRDRLKGFSHPGEMGGIVGAGSEAKFLRALGIPANPDTVKAVQDDRLDRLERKAKTKGRVLDVDDMIVEPTTKDDVAVFPQAFSANCLIDYKLETSTGSYRRRSYRAYEGVKPIVLGVARNGQYFQSPDYLGCVKSWPKTIAVAGTTDEFWNNMADRFLVTRSPLGWHGVFIINATVAATEERPHRIPEAPVCYMVPVFVPFAELRPNKELRMRRLPEDVKAAIRGSYGLSDFLGQSLMVLAGAKAKLARKGFTMDTLPRNYARITGGLPDGHLIRAWGPMKKEAAYEAETDTSYMKPRKLRAARVCYRGLHAFSGTGHVSFSDTVVVPETVAPVLQPVAVSRRQLEL